MKAKSASPARSEIGRVLIVSPHPLFAETLLRLVEQAGGKLIGQAPNVEAAWTHLRPKSRRGKRVTSRRERSDAITIIVEATAGQTDDPAWLKLLETRSALRRVILLTLDGNEMIVHEQRRVNHVSEQELVRALQGPVQDEFVPAKSRLGGQAPLAGGKTRDGADSIPKE